MLTLQLNHLVGLAKWLGIRLETEWLWIPVPLQSFTIKSQWNLNTLIDRLNMSIRSEAVKILLLSPPIRRGRDC